MKKLLIALTLLSACYIALSQKFDTIKLPAPVRQGGMPLMQALNERHSSRNYIDKQLSDQQMSDLLWAAFGINRADGRRTAPSARNKQEIEIYAATAEGVFLYDAAGNTLIRISSDDIRAKTGTQPWVKEAAVNLIYVCNKERSASSDETGILVNAAFSAGAIAQNVYLYCVSEGLGSVVRGSFDKNVLSPLLKITEKQVIIMTQTVGYMKEP
jgi:SagB-type dehydrogenase family enzyme